MRTEQRMASALTFLAQYHKDRDKFQNPIVTGDETWVSFVNVETKEQSKQWMHTYSPNKPKKFKQTLSTRMLKELFLGQERCADDSIHTTRDHNNVRSVLQNAKKIV
jgi:hypothetical protein